MLSHTIWMLEFSLSPLSFCFLMAAAASKWKILCHGQCQGSLLCLEHPVSSQKKKKSLYTFQDFSQAACLFIKALLGSLGMPFPSAILKAVASSLKEIYLSLRAAMTYSPTRGPSLRPSLKGKQREPKWDTVLFTLSKDEVGSGVSHGLSIMGEHFKWSTSLLKFSQRFLQQLKGLCWPMLVASGQVTHETKVQRRKARSQNSHRR